MTIQEWLGTDNTLGIDIWEKKYRYNNETFDEWMDRVSNGNNEVKELIKQKKFLFGGRILANRGLDKKGVKSTLSNCFDGDTKIITDNGLKSLRELCNTKVTLLSGTGWKEATVKSFGIQPVRKLILYKGKERKEFIVTDDHIWLVRNSKDKKVKEIKTIDLKPKMPLCCYTLNKIENLKNSWRVKAISDVIDEREVFCAVVPESHTFCLEGNILTHNCYVISPPEDSIESIFECASKLARTFSYGGGCGIDLSKLAPRGAKVNNTAKETSGSVSFMDLYSSVTELIGQNGRRGALMLSLSCDHPDLEEFIGIKSDLNRVTKANISIRITDKFMAAVKARVPFVLSFTRTETGETITKRVNAYDLFHKICEMNWNYAEPGMLFWDRIENWNLLSCDDDFHYAGTNPCAEEPLPAGGSCLLGSINLSEFVNNGKFNFDDFGKAVEIGVKALNEVLDEGLELHPLKEQRDSVGDWRQIGLGIMGLADMLIKMGIKYGSPKSINLCNLIGHKMTYSAIKASAMLAQKYGTYRNYNYSNISKSKFYREHVGDNDCLVQKYGLRNSQLLTIAPTGTLSTMLGISGGIEPIFANSYTRKTESLHDHDEYYKVYTPIVQTYMDIFDVKDEKELPEFFVTAQNIDYHDRVNMQAIWQEHIDASISSTVNLANECTVEDVEQLYMYAWERGLKGITIFRDGCARTGILTTDAKPVENEVNSAFDTIEPVTRKQLGNCLNGHTYVKNVACGKLYITINRDENDNLVEVFIDSGKSGGCSANAECLGRYASAAMRGGLSIDSIIDITRGVKCSACTQVKGSGTKQIDGLSCGDVLARTIKSEYEMLHGKLNPTTTKKVKIIPEIHSEEIQPKCPECGEPLVFEGGCNICKNCGWSKCG